MSKSWEVVDKRFVDKKLGEWDLRIRILILCSSLQTGNTSQFVNTQTLFSEKIVNETRRAAVSRKAPNIECGCLIRTVALVNSYNLHFHNHLHEPSDWRFPNLEKSKKEIWSITQYLSLKLQLKTGSKLFPGMHIVWKNALWQFLSCYHIFLSCSSTFKEVSLTM